MKTQVASGPIIVEDGKILLNREKKEYGITNWLFPGGKLNNPDENLEDACKREIMEELGLEIKIIKKLKTLEMDHRNTHYILHHYLAERINENIKPGKDIIDWAWHDIKNLPDNCAPNVFEIIEEYKNML